MDAVTTGPHRAAATRLRQLLARYADIEMLVRVGEYRPGSDALADESLRKIDAINAFLRQGEETAPFEQTLATLQELAA
jgi:type III secretion protein N (ATPase)